MGPALPESRRAARHLRSGPAGRFRPEHGRPPRVRRLVQFPRRAAPVHQEKAGQGKIRRDPRQTIPDPGHQFPDPRHGPGRTPGCRFSPVHHPSRRSALRSQSGEGERTGRPAFPGQRLLGLFEELFLLLCRHVHGPRLRRPDRRHRKLYPQRKRRRRPAAPEIPHRQRGPGSGPRHEGTSGISPQPEPVGARPSTPPDCSASRLRSHTATRTCSAAAKC